MLICVGFGLSWQTALVVSGAFAMSSTAIVSKLLVERLDLNSRHGRVSIGVGRHAEPLPPNRSVFD